MPQSDPEILTRSISDSIAYNTKLDDSFDSPPPPDYPAESFYLPKEAELDWFDRNLFYDRNESIKGNSNPISSSHRLSFNLKSKPSIIGLPKPHKTNYVHNNCSKPVNARFFPKRSRSSGKSNVPLTEPGSPKVSCIGRVRSKRERSRRNKSSQRANRVVVVVEPEKTRGLWKILKMKLGLGRRKTEAVDVDTPTEKAMGKKKGGVGAKKSMGRGGESGVVETPGLGELKRFASGRKTESWGGCDVKLEVSESDSCDQDHDQVSVWRRRGVGPPNKVDCGREWGVVGPATV